MEQHRNSLQPGYQLHWYLVQKILGQGGFGITYLAQDTNLNQQVAIKEYLPVELAVREDHTSIHPVSGEHGEQFRWGLERFITEAQTLARFKHPNIVRVLTVFRENNTAYMVMEYEHGRPLHEILKGKKTISEQELKDILLPIMDGLKAVHAENFIHRDIKPPNIYIREDGSPVLLDFGSARQSLAEQTRTLTAMVSPGYAPFEQYVSNSKKQGPWSDIYGLGATLYRAVTGIAPPDSMNRSEAILHTGKDIFVPASEISAGNYSAQFLAAIDHAMAFRPEDRPQSISAWQAEIDGNACFPDKKIPAINTTSEATTVAMISEVAPEPQAGLMDKSFEMIKRLLKWSFIILIILILLSVISQHKRNNTEAVKDTGNTPELVEPAVKDTRTAEEFTQQQPAGEDLQREKIREADNAAVIQELLNAAKADVDDLRLTSPPGNNALEKYQQVLQMEPGNARALQGLDSIVTEYIELMDNALSKDNFVQAENYLNRGNEINPDHPGLPAARARLKDAWQSAHSVQPQVAPDTEPAVQPETGPSRGLVPENERRRLENLKERIKANPRDMEARREVKNIAEQFETNIRQAVEAGDYDLAREYIKEMKPVMGDNIRARNRLDELLKNIEEKEKQAARRR